MFGISTQETVVIVEAKGSGKYAKQLYNMIGTRDDEGETIVGPRDGTVQASIFDENKFKCNQLSSEQKVIFVGNPKFAKDYLEALDSLATDKLDAHGVHIRIGGKHASIAVDGGAGNKEAYWRFLDFAPSKGQDLPDLMAKLRRKAGDDRGEADAGGDGPARKFGALFKGLADGARSSALGVGDKAAMMRSAALIEDQKYQFAIRLFYLEKLRAFVEG